ncbi:hypothetical protein [Nocardioides pacificus]
MTRVGWIVGLVAVLLLLSGCAAEANEVAGGSQAAGFWPGLWHGVISPVTLVISWFRDDVGIYEVANTGGWYDTGFILGASIALGGAGGSGAAGSRRRC